MSASGRDGLVLAVDLGTSGIKVGLVSFDGQIVFREYEPLQTRFLENGGAVQDAEAWWQFIVNAIRRAMRTIRTRTERAARLEQVVAVGITGQWGSTVPVDAHGKPVGDCVMWMDTRGGPHATKAFGGCVQGYDPFALAAWVRKTAGMPSTSGADPIGHMLHLERDQPEIARAARWFLEPVDYLSMRFTGVAAASHASMTAAWLTDNRHCDVLAYDARLVAKAGIDAGKLPPLVPTGTIVGTVREDVAVQLGIPASAKVVTGMPDLHTAAVGAGTVLDYEPHLAVSTTSWISCPIPHKKTDIFHQIATVPGLHPSHYLVADNQDSAGQCLRWLRDNVIAPTDGLFSHEEPPWDALVTLAGQAPVGSNGVLFTPWLHGERSPIDDRNARGGFHNLSLGTSRAHLVRAVLEGVAHNTRWLHRAVERFTKRRLDPIRIIGGGAQSDLWCQIMADILDRTIEQVDEPLQANLRGMAIFVGLSLGAIRLEEVRGIVPVRRTFAPDPGRHAIYDAHHDEFKLLYGMQKGMFARMNATRFAL